MLGEEKQAVQEPQEAIARAQERPHTREPERKQEMELSSPW